MKYTSKTTTCDRFAKTKYNLLTKREIESVKLAFSSDPSIIFNQQKLIFFDEVQKFPAVWNEVKSNIDENGGKPNQFLLSGSTIIRDDTNEGDSFHTGTGRFKEIIMRPMSLFESGESDGSISLLKLFDDDINISGIRSSLTLEHLIFATCRGGFPTSLKAPSDETALEVAKDYFNDIVTKDISDFDKIKRNPVMARRFLKAYSKNICTFVKNSKICAEIRGDDFSFSDVTYYDYKKSLDGLFVIEDVEAWSPLMKSKMNMLSSPKKNLAEPSIGIAALKLTKEKLSKNLYDYGFFFKSLCIRDLRIYSSKFDGEVNYYHDRNGLECDVVLTLKDGCYSLIEVKLGEGQAQEAEKHLLEIVTKIKAYNDSCSDPYMKMDLPSRLVIIVETQTAYDLKSGVKVVPIGCLRD